METKKEDQKLGSACNQESQTNEPQNNQDKAHPGDNASNSNQQQQPPNVQWSYTPQSATEQLMAVSIPTQAPSPVLNQWQQLPYSQQGQAFTQPTPPFWQPQWPGGGGPLHGANIPPIFHPFTPLGTTDTGRQAHPVVPGGTNQTLVPNMCYHVGYAFPGFSGPCDPPSWWGQIHQLQHPYGYNFPSVPAFSSTTPTMPGCLGSGEQSSQRGTMRSTAKLSQKHRQLWDAQSAENVQLWSLINKLQAEVSDYKDRLTKLEQEVSSLKQKVEESPTEVIGTTPDGTGQPRKRGRPKRSFDALHESHSRAGVRNPAPCKPQFETNSSIFEKVILKKVENKEMANHPTTPMAQQEIDKNILNVVTDVGGNIQINQSSSMSAYQGQVRQEHQEIQMCGSGTAFSAPSGVRANFEKDENLKIAHSKLSQPDKVLSNSMGVSTKYSFPHHGSFIQQGGKITTGWNFANEVDASKEPDDAIVGSAKDENELEMGDDISSAAKVSLPFNNW